MLRPQADVGCKDWNPGHDGATHEGCPTNSLGLKDEGLHLVQQNNVSRHDWCGREELPYCCYPCLPLGGPLYPARAHTC